MFPEYFDYFKTLLLDGYLLTFVICSFILYIKSYTGNAKNFVSYKYYSLFLIYVEDVFRTLSNV